MKVVSMKDCSTEDALTALNEGFQDYPVSIHMDRDGFLSMMSAKRLSSAYSFIVFDGLKPVGIVLNGIQEIEGIKTAYNGGTAVHPSYRKRGVGRLLVHSSLTMYEKEKASVATLEAISTNRAAIALYEAYGYDVMDRLHIMRSTKSGKTPEIQIRLKSMDEPAWNEQSFKGIYPWQNQAFCNEKAERVKVLYEEGVVGWLMFTLPQKGRMTLFQIHSENRWIETVTALLARYPDTVITAFNIPEKSPAFESLKQEGFETQMQQVWMKKVL